MKKEVLIEKCKKNIENLPGNPMLMRGNIPRKELPHITYWCCEEFVRLVKYYGENVVKESVGLSDTEFLKREKYCKKRARTKLKKIKLNNHYYDDVIGRILRKYEKYETKRSRKWDGL